MNSHTHDETVAGQAMPLGRQIFLGMTGILVLVLAGILALTAHATRAYLEEQLASHAQDTANVLSRDVSWALAQGDKTLAETVLAVVFDRGRFQRIDILGSDGTRLAFRESPSDIEGVPDWLPVLLPLETRSGQALVSSGWQQLGRVVVVSQPTLAYRYLWRSLLEEAAFMLGAFLLAILGMRLVLRRILGALAEVARVALDFCQRKFGSIAAVPRSRELAQVVVAMNEASRRVGDMLAAEEARAEGLRRQAFEDEVTGLPNRRGFELLLARSLSGNQAPGCLILLELEGLKELNLTDGYRAGNALLARSADLARAELGGAALALGRIGGAGFAFLCEGEEAAVRARADSLRAALAGMEAMVSGPVSFAMGMAAARAGDMPGRVLADADLALAGARQEGRNRLTVLRGEETGGAEPQGSDEWRRTLTLALAQGRLRLYAMPTLSLASGVLIHRDVLMRLAMEGEELWKAERFLAMAHRHHCMPALDRAVLERLGPNLGELVSQGGDLAVHLSGQSLADGDFRSWLASWLEGAGAGEALALEVPETACLLNLSTLAAWRESLRTRGVQFGINHFGLDARTAESLRLLLPDYVKLDGGLVLEARDQPDSRQVVASLVELAHSLEVRVLATHVESAALAEILMGLGVDGGQGYLFGQPEAL